MAKAAFPDSTRFLLKAPLPRTRWRSATTTKAKWSKARRCRIISASAWPIGTRCAARAATRSDRARCCGPGKGRPTRSRMPSTASPWPSSSSRSSARRSIASTTATWPPRAHALAETNKNLDEVVKVLKEEQAAHRHQAALGHRQPVQQSALHARRGHQLQRRRLRLRRRPGEKALEVTKELGGQGYTFWGGREGYQMPLEHRHEARAGPPGRLHAHGRRLCQEDRLHAASSTSSPSPRSRPSTSTTSTPPPASIFSAPTDWPITSS